MSGHRLRQEFPNKVPKRGPEAAKNVCPAGLRSNSKMLQRFIQYFLLSGLAFRNQKKCLRTAGKRLDVIQLALQLQSHPGMLSNFLLEFDRSQVRDLSLTLGGLGVVRHLKDLRPLIGLLVEDHSLIGVVLLEVMQRLSQIPLLLIYFG